MSKRALVICVSASVSTRVHGSVSTHSTDPCFQEGGSLESTVEWRLFRALEQCKLIPPGASPGDLQYTRCGRTDVGVSALCQARWLTLGC